MRSAALNGTAQQEQGQSDNHVASGPVQNFGAVMSGYNLAVAEAKTRSAPGFFTTTLDQNHQSQTQQGRP